MADLDNTELLYVAGIGIFANILLFATTLLISACKRSGNNQNTDIEAFHEEAYNDNDINTGLLSKDDRVNDGSSRVIDLIPSVVFSEVKMDRGGGYGCSICLRDGFEDEDGCKVLPGCDHVFHSECIDEWLKKSLSCPVCRKDFSILISHV